MIKSIHRLHSKKGQFDWQSNINDTWKKLYKIWSQRVCALIIRLLGEDLGAL
jgi:hypothetical protein